MWSAERNGRNEFVVRLVARASFDRRGSGLGPNFGISTEFILFARRGSLQHKEHHSGTCFTGSAGRHSEKPEAFYGEAFYAEVVEKVSPGPYVELFGRRPRPGWTVWGSDLTREPQIQGVVSAA